MGLAVGVGEGQGSGLMRVWVWCLYVLLFRSLCLCACVDVDKQMADRSGVPLLVSLSIHGEYVNRSTKYNRMFGM